MRLASNTTNVWQSGEEGGAPTSQKEEEKVATTNEQDIIQAILKGEQDVGREYLKVWQQSVYNIIIQSITSI